MTKKRQRSLDHAFSQMKSNKNVKPKAQSASAKRVKPSPRTNKQTKQIGKKGLHPRNLHRDGYDFAKLITSSPSFKPFVRPNHYGNLSIDFADAEAVKALNLALLRHHYRIGYWDIPQGYLCPPIPGRVDYLHYVADLLAGDHSETEKSTAATVRVLDVGTGANGIYPILGIQTYGWKFVGSDVDPISIANVETIIEHNKCLQGKLETRLQGDRKKIFHGIIKHNEQFDFTICNPPFHSSLAEATAGSQRKLKNLVANRIAKGLTKNIKANELKIAGKALNFGGQKAELWCNGGEKKFLLSMIRESVDFAHQCKWFSSLVSKKENLQPCYNELKKNGAVTVKTMEMAQGNKITRILAWTWVR